MGHEDDIILLTFSRMGKVAENALRRAAGEIYRPWAGKTKVIGNRMSQDVWNGIAENVQDRQYTSSILVNQSEEMSLYRALMGHDEEHSVRKALSRERSIRLQVGNYKDLTQAEAQLP